MSSSRKLDIITYPHPILDQQAAPVSFPLDQATKALIADMWTTVQDLGVGLAAPQVGVSKQICIIHLSEAEKDNKQLKQKDFVMINPVIIFSSELESLMIEGCLSFPQQYYEIWRPSNITVEYFDEHGKKHTLRAKEWLARVIEHEVDHLNGKVFIKMGGRKVEDKDLKERPID